MEKGKNAWPDDRQGICGPSRPQSPSLAQEEREQALSLLCDALAKGRRSGERQGWLTLEAVEASLGLSSGCGQNL